MLRDSLARPAHTLFNASQRPRFWNGFASDVGKASNICVKAFMKNGRGLSDTQNAELTAFLNSISPDAAAELDFRAIYRTFDLGLKQPAEGDANRGKALADRYADGTHFAAPTEDAVVVGEELARRWDLPRPKSRYAGRFTEGRTGPGGARVAVLPCCHNLDDSDDGDLAGWLDGPLAVDVVRAQRLRQRGYRVWTQTIPAGITPKNRLLLGAPADAG